MATTHQGYSSRYQKIKTNKLRSLSPTHYQETSKVSPSRAHVINSQTQLGKVVAQLTDRVDGMEIKLLFQKYTESKDIQYQKQKENDEFRKNIHEKIGSPESLQVQNKINQIDLLIQRTKAQMSAMQSLRISIERQNSKRTLCSPEQFQTIPKTLQSPSSPHMHSNTMSREIMQQIEEIMDRMQIALRQEMNKKIDICMSFFKNASQNSNRGQSSSSAVNNIMLQEQLHNATLTMNKIQADCHKNKMIVEAKIEHIVNFVRNLNKNNPQKQVLQSNKRHNNEQLDQSRHSSISKHSKKPQKIVSRSKSKSVQKSNSKYKKNHTDRSDNMNSSPLPSASPSQKSNKFQQQKRKKETELKQALRKKKENQQKLKMKS